MPSGDKQYCRRSIQLHYLRVLFVDKSRYFGCLYCANSVRTASLYGKYTAIYSIDVIVDGFDRFDLFFWDWQFAKS